MAPGPYVRRGLIDLNEVKRFPAGMKRACMDLCEPKVNAAQGTAEAIGGVAQCFLTGNKSGCHLDGNR
ncbi:hypothetical protein D3C76_1679890 [compost metagenome]